MIPFSFGNFAAMKLSLIIVVVTAAVLGCSLAVHVPIAGGSKESAAHIKTPWYRWFREKPVESEVVSGMRIPRRYFVTKGKEADML